MSGVIKLDSIEAYELFEKAVERTKEQLESESRRNHRQYAFRGEIELCSEDVERIRGAAMAFEVMFGIYDFAIVGKLGIDEARERFHKACDIEIANAKRRTA